MEQKDGEDFIKSRYVGGGQDESEFLTPMHFFLFPFISCTCIDRRQYIVAKYLASKSSISISNQYFYFYFYFYIHVVLLLLHACTSTSTFTSLLLSVYIYNSNTST